MDPLLLELAGEGIMFHTRKNPEDNSNEVVCDRGGETISAKTIRAAAASDSFVALYVDRNDQIVFVFLP